MLKYLIIIIVLLPFSAFAQNESSVHYFQKDDFASNAFGFPITIRNFVKKYGSIFTVDKKPVRNTNDKNIIDTIYTFTKNKTRIEIYHSKVRDVLKSAFIDTDNILFMNSIKTGISKSEVEKKLSIKIKGNKIQVGDLEQNQVYTFFFVNDRLINISYSGYLE